jgi:hypothetical protein
VGGSPYVHTCVYFSILVGNITRHLLIQVNVSEDLAEPYHLIINCMIECQVLIMNLKLEDWSSLASLGLAAMFITLLISFYNFLIGPEGTGPERVVEPGSLLIQLIFISAAPCLILAGFAFMIAKTYGSPVGGALLIAAGVIIVAGMAISVNIVPKIPHQYIVGAVGVAPFIFMPAGAGVTGIGGYMLAVSKRRHIHSRDLDDLR